MEATTNKPEALKDDPHNDGFIGWFDRKVRSVFSQFRCEHIRRHEIAQQGWSELSHCPLESGVLFLRLQSAVVTISETNLKLPKYC